MSKSQSKSYISLQQLKELRTTLEEMRAHIIQGTKETIAQLKSQDAHLPDAVDRASQEEECDLELHTRNRESKLIVKINKSLSKIDDGSYGLCLECGAEIGVERLCSRPTAELCIECKTLQEMTESS